MKTVVMCCGKVCSSKSTLSALLEKERNYVAFSADSWMLHFYGHIAERAQFDKSLENCKGMIYRVAERILSLGSNVVFDFGFWTGRERKTVRQRFESLGYNVLLVYFDISVEDQKRNLDARIQSGDRESYVFDAETLNALNARFEEPTTDEVTIPFRSGHGFIDRYFGLSEV